MTLNEASRSAQLTADLLERIGIAHQSLAFCAEVFQKYQSGTEPANEHMDVDKARNQLLDAVFVALRAGKTA